MNIKHRPKSLRLSGLTDMCGKVSVYAKIDHSRHRSVIGFTVNLIAGLAAYSFFPKKPMIDVDRVPQYEDGAIQLSLF